jgi:hypothetical protein
MFWASLGYLLTDFSNLKSRPFPKPAYRIIINLNAQYPLTPRQTLKLLIEEYLMPQKFDEYISHAMHVTYEKL